MPAHLNTHHDSQSPCHCIGEILWDCLADQPADSVDAVTSWTKYPGGAPANVACGLATLGIPTAFIGCIGGDDGGEQLVEQLRSRSINTAGIQRYLKATTRQVQVLRTKTGDRQFAGFIGHPNFADTHLQAQFLPLELFGLADFLVIGSLGFAYPETRQALQTSLTLADRHSLKVLMDVNWRPMFWAHPDAAKPMIEAVLPQVDVLKLSIEEAEWLFGTPDPKAIARLNNLEGVLMTQGAEGCTYCFNGNAGTVPGFAVEVEDTTGAGDGFVAGFLAQLCHYGISALHDPAIVRQMVNYANAVGAIVTTHAGAIAPQPTPKEVEAFLYLNQIRE
ncbi:MAG: carbohydrate kinase [Leptolyngbyaceae cyanobacterium CSU_1_4]|nr:carbohydrate kinase [Leptolyngbyaceae cyanobacterium CSU_1_4]